MVYTRQRYKVAITNIIIFILFLLHKSQCNVTFIFELQGVDTLICFVDNKLRRSR